MTCFFFNRKIEYHINRFSSHNFISIMELEHLRCIVRSREPKMKQIHMVLTCLNFSDNHPKDAFTIGCFWTSEKTFLIHSGIFGAFVGRKANTINRNFRTHGFTQNKSSAFMRCQIPSKFDLRNLPDPSNWFQRQCEGFTKETTEKEAISWEFHQIIPKSLNKASSLGEETKTTNTTKKPKKPKKTKKTTKSKPVYQIQNNFIIDKIEVNIKEIEIDSGNLLFMSDDDHECFFDFESLENNTDLNMQSPFDNTINDNMPSIGDDNECYYFSDDCGIYY